MPTNDIKVQDVMAGTALKYLKNSLVMPKLVSRGYEGEFSKEVNGYKKGATVRVRRPENFTPSSGATLSVADVEEATTTVTVDQQYNKGLSFLQLGRHSRTDNRFVPGLPQGNGAHGRIRGPVRWT